MTLQTTARSGADSTLLELFNREVKSRVPHLEHEGSKIVVVNTSRLVDITDDLIECGRTEYGLDISGRNCRVFGKLESDLLGSSVKVRPAVQIIEDAIVSGKLRRGTPVFEATSGNFGIALGLMKNMGLNVVVLISRKLQDGVIQELKKLGVKMLNLDMDICPAPGVAIGGDKLVAKVLASSVMNQLGQNGFDTSALESSRELMEDILTRGDAMGLAKHLAVVYHGFCPEQYDNELNVRSHELVTGPEIEQQLEALGESISEVEVVCAFGTGGTATGLSRYMRKKSGRKSVHVVFPLANQDVAGVRNRERANGLRFYEPNNYAGTHEVDFEEAKRAFRFLTRKGYDIGESSALALYATLQMLHNDSRRLVVILADGVQKYTNTLEVGQELAFEVTKQQAGVIAADFGVALWTHPVFVPSKEGVKLISSLGFDEKRIKVANTRDVESLYTSQETAAGLERLLPNDAKRALLVCVNGSTSLKLAQLLSKDGIEAASLAGGLTGLGSARNIEASELLELAPET